MSFGKRGVPQNQAALRSNEPESGLPNSPRGGGFRIPKIVKQLGQIALTLGFLMLCFNFLPLLVNFVVVPAIEDSDSPSEFSMQVASSLGPGKISGIDARINVACLAPKQKKRLPLLLKETTSAPTGGSQAPAAILATVELATRYLSCAAAIEPKHFCDSFYREQLAANLSNYFESKRYYIAYLKTVADQKSLLQMKDAYASTPVELEKALLTGVALEVVTINAETAGAEFKLTVGLNPKLSAGISSLVRSGLFSANDFGWTNPVPDELRELLAVPAQQGIC